MYEPKLKMSFYNFAMFFILSLISFYVVSGRLYVIVRQNFVPYFLCVLGIAFLSYTLRFDFSLNYWGLAFSLFLLFTFLGLFLYEKRRSVD